MIKGEGKRREGITIEGKGIGEGGNGNRKDGKAEGK